MLKLAASAPPFWLASVFKPFFSAAKRVPPPGTLLSIIDRERSSKKYRSGLIALVLLFACAQTTNVPGLASHASPPPPPSLSFWSTLAVFGQLSQTSPTLSPSVS